MSSKFEIHNKCDYKVWAAALPGGGKPLEHNETWTILDNDNWLYIWGRTNCTFNESGEGKCTTGDCNGLLQCQTKSKTPTTLATFDLNEFYYDLYVDYFDIPIENGYNVPMQLTTTEMFWTYSIICTSYVNGQCPNMKFPVGCNKTCPIIKGEQHCCQSCLTKHGEDDVAQCSGEDPGGVTNKYRAGAGSTYEILFCP